MDADRPMYRWRKMTPEQRQAALDYRQQHQLPLHAPPHYTRDSGLYLITAACYEHKSIIGVSHERMGAFEKELLETIATLCPECFAWNVLPNHYHLLLRAPDIEALIAALGQLHGRTSFNWNGEEDERGQQVWHRAAETGIKSEGHFFATLNYVLNNAVRHKYVSRWQDWPYSNAEQYLADIGRDEAERRWREYPVLDYGKEWDPPDL